MSRASRVRNRSTRSRAALSMVAHQAAVMPPHAAQMAFVHGESAGAAVGLDFVAMEAAADELPIVALGADAALIALHDLDIVGRDEAGRAESEFVLPEARLVDLGRRALQQHRLVIDEGLVDAHRLEPADMRHDVDEV